MTHDTNYNASHCDGCSNYCSLCNDTFDGEDVYESKSMFGKPEKTGSKYLWRYSQRKTIEELSTLQGLTHE